MEVIRLKRVRVWLALLSCIFVSGCRVKPDQALEEYNGASFITRVVAFYERQNPNVRLTNLHQAFDATGTPYPARYHHYFRAFGKHSGFRNSIFEKYVFVFPPITNRAVMGEIVLLNAQPFPDQKGKNGRIICSKTPLVDDGWMVKWYSEEEVKEFFRAAGQSIPKPVPMPPPTDLAPSSRPPLPVRVEEYFGDITENLGMGTNAGKYLMWITFTLAAVVLTVLGLIGWRKWR